MFTGAPSKSSSSFRYPPFVLLSLTSPRLHARLRMHSQSTADLPGYARTRVRFSLPKSLQSWGPPASLAPPILLLLAPLLRRFLLDDYPNLQVLFASPLERDNLPSPAGLLPL
jgi:hypothetical protein